MNHADLVALIRDGVPAKGGRWADLGAGEGAFTRALADLVGPGAHITAVDKDAGSLRRLDSAAGKAASMIETLVSDFTRALHLTNLDGVLMANSLHFVRDKEPVLRSVRDMLRPGGTLIVVEYDADRGNPWVPYPLSYRNWQRLAAAVGFDQTRQFGSYPSRYLRSMYGAVSSRPRQ